MRFLVRPPRPIGRNSSPQALFCPFPLALRDFATRRKKRKSPRPALARAVAPSVSLRAPPSSLPCAPPLGAPLHVCYIRQPLRTGCLTTLPFVPCTWEPPARPARSAGCRGDVPPYRSSTAPRPAVLAPVCPQRGRPKIICALHG